MTYLMAFNAAIGVLNVIIAIRVPSVWVAILNGVAAALSAFTILAHFVPA